MTIAWLCVGKPAFLSSEMALTVCDFFYESINMRTDGRRPTLQCLTDCYMAMFGEAARCIQNESTTLELWLTNNGNWQHYWRESIVSFDQVGSERASASMLFSPRTTR